MPDSEMLEMYRNFLKQTLGSPWGDEPTHKARGVPAPPRQEPYPPDATLIDLTPVEQLNLGRMPVAQAIRQRRSRRQFADDSLTLDELSFLLWATQGVKKNLGPVRSLRTVPAGGAVHSLETYLSVHRVVGLEPGLYRYLPEEHKLCLQYHDAALGERFRDARGDEQQSVAKCAVYFVWTVIPYRWEWRGGYPGASVAMQVGHVCQNLYLASEAIGCGTCATTTGGTFGDNIDGLLGVNGRDEFTVYAAAVGKLRSGREVDWSGLIERVEDRGDATLLWVKSFSWWDGDVFVAEFPGASVGGYAEGDFVGILGEIVDMCSPYDGWPLVRGTAIEGQEDPYAGFEY